MYRNVGSNNIKSLKEKTFICKKKKKTKTKKNINKQTNKPKIPQQKTNCTLKSLDCRVIYTFKDNINEQ